MIESSLKTNPENCQRKYERISTHRPADVTIGDKSVVATLINLSIDGAGLMIDTALELKQQIQVRFCLPSYDQSSELNLTGLVTHITNIGSQYLIGLQFAELTRHENLVMTGFIKYHHRLD